VDIIHSSYYITGTELMKLNFCRFIRLINDMGLTRSYKTEVFLHLYL